MVGHLTWKFEDVASAFAAGGLRARIYDVMASNIENNKGFTRFNLFNSSIETLQHFHFSHFCKSAPHFKNHVRIPRGFPLQ